jgi:ketosteroid isomerase-like protein
MTANEQLVQKFYTYFQQRDAQGMASCYHDEVEFSDAVFPHLHGARANAMWRMLCERAKDLEISVSGIHADERTGNAHWEARYTFSQTGRKVHNKIEASFQFKDGKIIKHEDKFDLWRWTRMALGVKGLLFGWLPSVQAKIRREANRSLEVFMNKTESAATRAQ